MVGLRFAGPTLQSIHNLSGPEVLCDVSHLPQDTYVHFAAGIRAQNSVFHLETVKSTGRVLETP